MISNLIRVALTSMLVVLLLLLLDEWDAYASSEFDHMANFFVGVGMAVLVGVGGMVWAFKTRAMGAAVRATLSVPLLAVTPFLLVWLSPPFSPALAFAFEASIILGSFCLFLALWYYWPEKKKG